MNVTRHITSMIQRRYLSSLPYKRRVVVTGMGVVTCLGVGLDNVWPKLVGGQCGISKLSAEEYEQIPCKVAGVVPRGNRTGVLNIEDYISKSEQRGMSLASCYAIVAAQEAVIQSGWKTTDDRAKERAGVAVGMGMVDLEEIVSTGSAINSKSYRRVSPHFIPRILVNMAAGHISLRHGLKGVNHSVSTACTTGVHAIGDAARFIQHGDVDLMVCGGTEASVNPIGMGGFARMRALSTKYNDSPTEASRPFDKGRDGFVMAEGAGILVLEELHHALNRGANIYGEILGYGLSGDSSHITAPHSHGDGAFRCMKSAIGDANISHDNVKYINAHATSTPLGDEAEVNAIMRLFGENSEYLSISSTKGAVGHLLGAAGSVETIFTLMACHTGTVPPTLNCHDTEFNLNFVPLKSQTLPTGGDGRRIALANSFGFGGTNASLCVSNFVEQSK